MPRTARFIVPNCPHHIVQRGHNRNEVFIGEEDYQYYLSTLKDWKLELGIKVYAYCLMTNHIHLVLEPGDRPESIGLLMKRLAGRQTRRINKLKGWTGSLWDGRYKISPIDTDNYLMRCCRYVELNPVKAGMVAKAQDYRWSSYPIKIGKKASCWLDLDACYMWLEDREIAYRLFVEEGVPQKEQRFISEVLERNHLTGDATFIDEVEKCLGIRVEDRKPGRPKK